MSTYKQHKRAKQLRAEMPPAEKRLWYFIRAKRLNGLHFRRQYSCGPYIVDFACHKSKLVIELDGSQHAKDAHRQRDQRRDAYLESQGFTVLRFWNDDIFKNIDGVLEKILAAVEIHRDYTTLTAPSDPR